MVDYKDNLDKILDLLKENPRGLNIREIAGFIGASRISTAKYLDVLVAEKKIEVRVMGKAKIFYVFQVSTPQSLLNRIPSMILILGADARVIQANDHFLKHCSLSQKQVFGQPLDAIPRGITREPAFLAALDEAIRTRTPIVDLTVVIPADDKTFRVTLKPTSQSDNIFGITAIMNDITGPKGSISENERGTDNLYRMLLEDIGVAACVVQAGKIRLANARFAGMSGYSYQELVSRSFSAFIHPEDHGKVLARLEPCMQETLVNAHAPFRGITKSGSVIRLDARAVPFSWKKEPAFLVFFCTVSTGQVTGDGAPHIVP